MSSPSSDMYMYTLITVTDDEGASNGRRESVTRFELPINMGANSKSVRSASPVLRFNGDTDCETIRFVYLDLQSELTTQSIASLRVIHHDILTYTDSSSCLDFVRSVHDRIFFITSSADRSLIEEFHNVKSVEAMFILNSDGQIDARLPKLYGVYEHFEELLMALRNTLEWFEQTQVELFLFERDRMFLWALLWKEEYIKLQKSKSSFTKEKLVQLARNYYSGNLKMHQAINEFDQSYAKGDALHWCFSSPFPSRFLHHTILTHDVQHLQACQFLLIDASRAIQLSSKKSGCELYKGMKMTNEYLEKLEEHIGKLICPKGFLQCSQSRKIALTSASSPDHRPDLLPVLFKISYDTSVPFAELSHKDSTSSVIFDISTVFRVKYVSRGQVSTVKIELADEDGRKFARMYRSKHEAKSTQDLLDELLSPSKRPVRLPPLQRTASSPSDLATNEIGLSVISEDDEETQAQELIEQGQIDQALDVYRRLKPESAQYSLRPVYCMRKRKVTTGRQYNTSRRHWMQKRKQARTTPARYHAWAMLIRILVSSIWPCPVILVHFRKRKKTPHIDQTAVASSLIGMANAYWGQQNLPQALEHAQQALALNESIEHGNDLNIAANLAILANIYHNSGDNRKALELATRALGLLERCVPADSLALATLINNVATIQVAEKLFTDARQSYDRALKICTKSLPKDHPRRLAVENNIQRITEMEEQHAKDT